MHVEKSYSDIEIHAASIDIVNIKHAFRISDVDRTSIDACPCTSVKHFHTRDHRYGDLFKVCLTARVMRWPIARSHWHVFGKLLQNRQSTTVGFFIHSQLTKTNQMRGTQTERWTVCNVNTHKSTRIKQIAQSRKREHEILWFSYATFDSHTYIRQQYWIQ